MAEKTIYCAQPFWRRAGRLIPGEPLQFIDRERAAEGARILTLGSADGVAVFSLTGDPAADYWAEPVLLAKVGQVPPLGDPDQSQDAVA